MNTPGYRAWVRYIATKNQRAMGAGTVREILIDAVAELFETSIPQVERDVRNAEKRAEHEEPHR